MLHSIYQVSMYLSLRTFVYDTIRYDTIRCIYVRSKVDEMVTSI